jgi:hypothetical protein
VKDIARSVAESVTPGVCTAGTNWSNCTLVY